MTHLNFGDQEPIDVAADWLRAFGGAMAGEDAHAAAQLMLADSHWRDVVSFTWDIRTFSTRADIEAGLKATLPTTRPAVFEIDVSVPPRLTTFLDESVIEAMFTFETAVGRGRGLVRLVPPGDGGGPRAWTLLTMLTELKGYEEEHAEQRVRGASAVRTFGAKNWLDLRREAVSYTDADPTVLIVGGGQSGLMLAARLNQLNVDNLVVDPFDRIGDNWRRRYHSLVLHNETPSNEFPYLPFPGTWPMYLSKDQIANWLEFYADALEINVWTQTRFVDGVFDSAADRWRARLRFGDGSERTINPRHVVMATGAAGIPCRPEIAGLSTFGGEVVHSTQYSEGRRYAGKNVVVFGSGNSAHDVAQDLHGHGAAVTMVQRGSTTVVSVYPSARMNAELYLSGYLTEDADLMAASVPHALFVRNCQRSSQRSRVLDRELLDGLASVGFRTDFGEDDTGWTMKYRQKNGGYYLNVGCSDLIVTRKIHLVQNADMAEVVPGGLRMKDGTTVPADVIVLATGYLPQQALIAQMFGGEIASAVGPIWGLDHEGELRNVWRPTAQRQLWVMAGSLLQARLYSRALALQIKADEVGLTRNPTAGPEN